MRARASAFLVATAPVLILTLGSTMGAQAQNGGFTRFPAPSADACAASCASDQMCVSWSFGATASFNGPNQSRGPSNSPNGGTCSFSSSPTPQTGSGIVSGFPRRSNNSQMASYQPQPQPQQNSQAAYSGQNNGANAGIQRAQTGWEVRPAPWLRGLNNGQVSSAQSTPPRAQTSDFPAPQTQAVNASAPRIEFDTPSQNPITTPRPVALAPPPTQQAPYPQVRPTQATTAQVPRVRPSYSGTSTTAMPSPQPQIQSQPIQARVTAPSQRTPVQIAPVLAPRRSALNLPAPTPPTALARPVSLLTVPPPPPGTQEMPPQSQVSIALPRSSRGPASTQSSTQPASTARAMLPPRAANVSQPTPIVTATEIPTPAAQISRAAPRPMTASVPVRIAPVSRAPATATAATAIARVVTVPVPVAPSTRQIATVAASRPVAAPAANAATGRGAPPNRAAPVQRPTPAAAVVPASTPSSTQGAPPRQEVAVLPSSSRPAARRPVSDPFNPESFRGADGMIDAAEMRRAQLNASREQGRPAYSVQTEWEAVAAEQQRAEAAGEVRIDPLAGTSPVPPPPETRSERRAREAAEAAEDAADARAASNSEDDSDAAPSRPAATSRVRGTPRVPRQTSSVTQNQSRQTASTTTRRQTPTAPQALDREPRLSGGPG